jgi:Predicted membrane protein
MENLQELLQEIGSGKMEPAAPAPTQEPPKETAQPAAKAPEPPKEPAKESKITTEAISKNTPTEPATTVAKSNEPAAQAPPAQGNDIPDEAFYGRLSKLTDNTIKTEQDFVGLIEHYNELLEKSEKGFEPKFQNERAKWAYQVLTQNAGSEPEAAMRTLRALNFDPKGKEARDVLFEAYLQDPKNSDLTALNAQKYFDAEYDEKYGDVEGNPIKERQLALAVREATQSLEKIRNDFSSTEEPAKQISEEVENSISSAVEDFGGVRLAFSDNPQETDFLNMPIEDPNEIESLKQDALNPQEWWAKFLQGFDTDKGFDYPNFIREFHEMRNHQKKAQLAFDHGRKIERVAYLNEARNASDPKDISRTGAPAAGGKEPTFVEAWANAAKG